MVVEPTRFGVLSCDDPPSATEAVAKLRLRLHHLTVEELEWVGLVRWDRANDVVTTGPHFDEES